MSGLAITDNFMLSTATVMIGDAADLNDLNPLDHSIGLVKNFTITSEPAYTELTQGVKNDIVHSVMTSNPVRATMETYEFTAKNLAYSLGLDGGSIAPATVETTVASPVSASPTVSTITVTSATGITNGTTILIEVDTIDNFVIRTVTNVAGAVLTLDSAMPAVAAGAKVFKVNKIEIGSKTEQPFFGAKIAGRAANGDNLVLLLPKVRITKGFNLAFISDNYGNLPFEFTLYDLVSTDPNYAAFRGVKGHIYRK